MRDSITLSDRPADADAAAGSRHERNRDYHRRRAIAERVIAERSSDPASRTAHLQLAELHEAALVESATE